MSNSDLWAARIKAVEREYKAARVAADRMLLQFGSDPAELTGRIDLRDARLMSDNLEGTYLVRLFSEFESALRSYWVVTRSTPPPQSRDLIASIAATSGIMDELTDRVHDVRRYRNALVHSRGEATAEVAMGKSRSALCGFVSLMRDRRRRW